MHKLHSINFHVLTPQVSVFVPIEQVKRGKFDMQVVHGKSGKFQYLYPFNELKEASFISIP